MYAMICKVRCLCKVLSWKEVINYLGKGKIKNKSLRYTVNLHFAYFLDKASTIVQSTMHPVEYADTAYGK